jgi:hypothetical protein
VVTWRENCLIAAVWLGAAVLIIVAWNVLGAGSTADKPCPPTTQPVVLIPPVSVTRGGGS